MEDYIKAAKMGLDLQNQVAELAAVGTRTVNGTVAVTTDDKWHLGSLTKNMTATLAGVLVEMSVVSWDTTPLDPTSLDFHSSFSCCCWPRRRYWPWAVFEPSSSRAMMF